MKEKHSLDRILASFDPSEPQTRLQSALTIWVCDETKARYQKLQNKTGRRFSRTLRELVEAAIELAEAQAS